ncbi:MAG: hypothetical protein IKX05_03590, partial [Bacteroidales bacterium]|nr:hypothetical protein [Bacteroidales bacterium]
LSGAGSTSLPLSSSLLVYFPKKLTIGFVLLLHAIGHKDSKSFPFFSNPFQIFPQSFEQPVKAGWPFQSVIVNW